MVTVHKVISSIAGSPLHSIMCLAMFFLGGRVLFFMNKHDLVDDGDVNPNLNYIKAKIGGGGLFVISIIGFFIIINSK